MGCSREDIIRMVKEEDVKFIRMQFTDIFGHVFQLAKDVEIGRASGRERV